MGRPKKYKTEEERKAAIRERNRRYYQENHDYYKQRYIENREEILEQHRRWREANSDYRKCYYQENIEKEIEQHKQYYQENKEKLLEQRKQYYQENREEILEQRKEYQKQYLKTPMGRAANLVSTYQYNDKKYNRGECTLTAKWIVDNIFNKPCHYNCGETDWTKLGCDRINNELPHTPDNVVPCCEECNKKRGTMSYEKFKQMTIPSGSGRQIPQMV